MRIVVLVHPGSHFTSGASQVPASRHEEVTAGLVDDLQSAYGIVVIDGSLSDGIPHWFEAEIAATLQRADRNEAPSFRIWGCDSGERPYAAWKPHGGGVPMISDGQEAAAMRVWAFLPAATEIIVTGAWATRDGSSGCVNSVADVLRDQMLRAPILVSENALFEEYMEEDLEP